MDLNKYPRVKAFMESHPEMTLDEIHDNIATECKRKGLT